MRYAIIPINRKGDEFRSVLIRYERKRTYSDTLQIALIRNYYQTKLIAKDDYFDETNLNRSRFYTFHDGYYTLDYYYDNYGHKIEETIVEGLLSNIKRKYEIASSNKEEFSKREFEANSDEEAILYFNLREK